MSGRRRCFPNLVARLALLALAATARAGLALAQASDAEICLRPADPGLQIAACTRLIEAKPTNPADLATVYFHRGAARRAKKEFDAAIQDFDAGLRLDPNSEQGYVARGVTYALLRQPGAAIRDFDAALRLNPADLEGHAYRGMAYAQQGQYDSALRDFDEVIQRDPKSPAAYYQRGVVYRLMARHEQAFKDFDTAVRLQPDNPIALNDLGMAYLYGLGVAKDTKRAIELFSKSAEMGFAPAKENLAKANAATN